MIFFANTLSGVAYVLNVLLTTYFWIVVIAALITWVRPDPSNPIVRILRALTQPVLYRIRKWLPFTYAAGIDFSPIVLLLAIELVKRICVKSLLEYSNYLLATT